MYFFLFPECKRQEIIVKNKNTKKNLSHEYDMYSTTKSLILFIITFSNVDHTTVVEGLLIFPHTRHSLQLSSEDFSRATPTVSLRPSKVS